MNGRLLWFGTTFALSAALAAYLTPTIRRGALTFGVMDQPDGGLKRQTEAVPYLGGIAVYLAYLLTLSVVFEFGPQLLGLLLGGTLMTMLGLFDDLRVLSPALKLVGQLLGAWVLLRCGIYIKLMWLPEWVTLGLSVLWIVGVTNAVNIIDVSDGLTGSVGAVAAFALFLVALANGNDLIATATLALCGSLLGFLPTNWAPARIYLGDAGSLFVGFMLASLSMIGAYSDHNLYAVAAPLGILLVPLCDITLVSVVRLRKGMSPLRGSPDHFALRLKARGWSTARVAHFAWILGACGAAAAWCLIEAPPTLAPWLLLGGGVAALLLLAWFGTLPPPAPRR
ncbi:MAG TPA: MraY family glycosyltransferase [Myxococcota bacterium]|nr:MraY family glycosyltransferase [Myxococcota bacterium]